MNGYLSVCSAQPILPGRQGCKVERVSNRLSVLQVGYPAVTVPPLQDRAGFIPAVVNFLLAGERYIPFRSVRCCRSLWLGISYRVPVQGVLFRVRKTLQLDFPAIGVELHGFRGDLVGRIVGSGFVEYRVPDIR